MVAKKRERRKKSLRKVERRGGRVVAIRGREIFDEPVEYRGNLYTEVHLVVRPSSYVLTLRSDPLGTVGLTDEQRGQPMGQERWNVQPQLCEEQLHRRLEELIQLGQLQGLLVQPLWLPVLVQTRPRIW